METVLLKCLLNNCIAFKIFFAVYLMHAKNFKSPFVVRLAKLAVDKVLISPCETSVLYPNCGGNVHCFTAVGPCAILDILTPPYREDVGRKCTYYHDYPYTAFCK